MDWTEALIAVPVALMFGLCALTMLSMNVRGWLGGGRHSGHGMMDMCMGRCADDKPRTPDVGLLEELKSERERLDALISRAKNERMAAGR
jgi:hypothetical protein